MKKVFAAVAFALIMCGCATEQVAQIHGTVGAVLEIAYANGGAVPASEKIDELVADGKITAEQATALKNAAQQSYEPLQRKLAELQASDVEVTEQRTHRQVKHGGRSGPLFLSFSPHLLLIEDFKRRAMLKI